MSTLQRYDLALKQRPLELQTTWPPSGAALLTQIVLAEGSTDVISLLLETNLTLHCSEALCQVALPGHSEVDWRFPCCSTFRSAGFTLRVLPKGVCCELN